MTTARSLLVVGSINVDLVIELDQRPTAGQTVNAQSLRKMPGGKGANQAAAGARAGVVTSLLGAVGSDSDGQAMVDGLRAHGVATGGVRVVEAPTGTAVVLVTPDGENSIIVVAGANGAMRAADVSAAASTNPGLVGCVMTQLEVPEDVVIAAGRLARRAGAWFVLNASPLSGDLASLREVALPLADPLVVNLGEAKTLLADAALADGSLGEVASALVQSGAQSAVVTGGADGAGWADGSASGTVPAAAASVVDTTGAGDAFAGALAAALTRGGQLLDAVASGVEAGARATEWRGAQPWAWPQ